MTLYEKAILITILLSWFGIVAFFGYDCIRCHWYLRRAGK